MDDIRTLYGRWLFDLWHGDFAVAEEILTPDFVGHWPTMDVHGPDRVVEQIRQSHEYFGDIENTLDVGPVIGDGMVAARWTFHGSYRGGVPGASVPSGTRISFAGQDLFRLVDGRFAEYWVVSDTLGMMAALGALGDR
ncbi:ester cyclase [Streptomyces sp. ACA25]|uniref:ester cyclase n=1 Tax=Streptomyces sp. ACA25 TaxID=3022596 RepID=UPI002307FD11|nr:ester cyclase [Streptomyces sp. ACA25]MDB1086398.1 ester cyclase [Streptomyces sp. ACA25]